MPARDSRGPDPSELAALMVAYRGGDLAAFDGLYASVAPVLRRYLLALARDAAWTDDLVQETFLQMHRSRHTYNAAYPVLPWAFAIARHVFLMGRRTRKRKGDFDHDVADDRVMARARDHEAGILARDAVARAMETLTPGTRRAVWLHHVLGLSFADVARRLAIREPAAKLRASRGMASLRRALGERPRKHGS